MNSILQGGTSLARFIQVDTKGDELTVRFECSEKIVRGELCFTRDSGKWQDRKWESILGKRLQVDATDNEAEAGGYSVRIPNDATVWYFNLFDSRDCVVSSEYQTR
jgi:hypothetical protein